MKARFVSNLPEKGILGAFANALRRLAQTKTFEQITVRAIVQEAEQTLIDLNISQEPVLSVKVIN